jgi:hypothetical protein
MNRVSIATIIIELFIAMLSGIASLGLYLSRSPWNSGPVGRLLAAWIAIDVVETGSLLTLTVIRVPVIYFAVMFGILDAVYIWLLVTIWRSQNDQPPSG